MASEAILDSILRGMGIPTGAFTELIHRAILGSWTPEQLIAEMYSSEAFKAMFPGIFRPDGSLLMSPGEYRSASDTYTHLAYTFGYHIGRDVVGNLISGMTSPQEFADKLTAVNRIKESPEIYAAFAQTLKANGVKDVTRKGLLDFALGDAPRQWYDLYEETSIVGAAKLAGVPGGLSHQEAQQLMSRTPGRLDEASLGQGFADLAFQYYTNKPLSQLYGFGITKSELLQYEFGGPHKPQITEKLTRIAATDQAFQNARASDQLTPTTTGHTTLLGGAMQPTAQSL